MNFITKYIFLLILIFSSCAVQAPPSGGQEDTVSPYIVEVSPLSGSMNLSDKDNIEIIFNEMIDPNSIKSSIETYPDIEIKISRYGKKIIIKPKDKWPLDNIFKIKVKRGISDYFGNKLESGKVLTYSTSKKISDGFIKGKVFNNDNLNLSTIALYEIINNELFYYSSIENDSNNMYSFENIGNGNYVVVAIENNIEDIYNDVEKYSYGIYTEIIQLTDQKNKFNDINIMLSFPDYKDDIIYLTSYNNFYGEIEFLSGDEIFLINEVLNKDRYQDNKSYVLYDNSLDSININYDMRNYIRSYTINNRYKLNKILIDSISPEINDSYFDNQNYILKFSEPVYVNSIASPFYLIDDNDTTFLKYNYLNPYTIELNDIDLVDNQIYMNNLSITDYSESKNILIDGKINLFSGLKQSVDNGGDISGNISYSGNNNIIVELKNINSNEYNRLLIDMSGEFKFENMAPGKYSIWAYEHINPITDYYYNGSLKPFKLGARFGLYSGQIEVRANWDIEGINFNIDE